MIGSVLNRSALKNSKAVVRGLASGLLYLHLAALSAAELKSVHVNCIFGDSPPVTVEGMVGDTFALQVLGGDCQRVRSTEDKISGPDSVSQSAMAVFKLESTGRGKLSMVSEQHDQVISIPFAIAEPSPRAWRANPLALFASTLGLITALGLFSVFAIKALSKARRNNGHHPV